MRLYLYLICLVLSQSLHAQTASFMAPDTVCIGDPVTITDQSTSVSTWQWNFCTGASFQPPAIVNHGNPVGFFQSPDHSVIVEEGGFYYAYVTNATVPRIMQQAYGNSLANVGTPTTVSQIFPLLPNGCSGIQAVQDAAGKHLIAIGSNQYAGGNIVRIDFGNDWGNFAAVTGIDWGNPGGLLANSADLAIARDDNGQYYGFVINQGGPAMFVRLEFGADFSAAPAMTGMGNLGGGSCFPKGSNSIKKVPTGMAS